MGFTESMDQRVRYLYNTQHKTIQLNSYKETCAKDLYIMVTGTHQQTHEYITGLVGAWASLGHGPLEVWVCGQAADLQHRKT